jgi:hypothetical protein
MLELLRIGCNQFDALFEGQTVLDMMLASVSNPEDLDPEIQGVIDVLVQQGAHCNPKYNTVFWASKIKPEAFVEQPTQDAQAVPDAQAAPDVPDLNAMGNAADAPPDHI